MTKPSYDVAYHWTRGQKTGWTTIGHAFTNDGGRIKICLGSLPVPGTEIIGPLPQPLQAVTTFAAGYGRDTSPARAVIATLRGDKAAAIMTHAGLEPL